MRALILALTLASLSFVAAAKNKPNFILIFTDDLGYQDLSSFGSPKIKTPNIDSMAAGGMKMTDFYAQTVCGPSRAALMTASYPLRTAKKQNKVTIHPFLHLKEVTIAEVLKPAGYTSGIFGKWDLAGHNPSKYDPNLLPLNQGFDYYFGTPGSNDKYVPLIRNQTVIENEADMSTLTERYTDEAIKFITDNQNKPFFVYLSHTMPHTRLAASKKFKGRSARGLYGDVVEEIDYNVGRVLQAVEKLNLMDNTYVIFTSDNGPWHVKKSHGGSALPLRGAKTSTWEGGVRVPFVIYAPGRVPAGVVNNTITTTMDILPTFANLAGTQPPSDRIIDGIDISQLIHGEVDTIKDRTFYYYQHTHLQAVRYGKWKLHLPRLAQSPWSPKWSWHIAKEDVIDIPEPMLIDLEKDISETQNVAKEHPEIVNHLLKLAKAASNDIGDYDRAGTGARFFDPDPIRQDAKKWAK
ncbi:sulfatase [Gayadomonas joobiniege]|uniref:sulfatase family protein n=1 Tax=Gayadomonas joobiniege TaxID=1234606 RepID=UPI000372EFDF|nr:sulfatase [Gayadomonas joobiniege]